MDACPAPSKNVSSALSFYCSVPLVQPKTMPWKTRRSQGLSGDEGLLTGAKNYARAGAMQQILRATSQGVSAVMPIPCCKQQKYGGREQQHLAA
ncbi:hypothetical protein An07g04100 [Aspergillus niger]|uniref:Uncharacterized protein n=2 Tax=Aspergillus niger TaxID=5061 RepID=A2QN19_ASPNC|nr:hypothetical protein An07g04100 [Aspergillus niger]CAK48160.1 hypothetical protein An07g04100 [Aspergillus niger]